MDMVIFNGFALKDNDLALVGVTREGKQVTTVVDPVFRAAAVSQFRQDGIEVHGFIRRKGGEASNAAQEFRNRQLGNL